MHARRSSAALVVALFVISGCSSETSPGDTEEPLPEVGFQLYVPELDGAVPEQTTVGPGVVLTQYDDLPALVQLAAPGGDLCLALVDHRMADDTCRVEDGVAITSMEEMGGVGLVRGGTLLYWHTLVSEVDPGVLDRAEMSLREAPEGTLEDLGTVSRDEGLPTEPGTDTGTGTESEEPEPGPVSPADFDEASAMDTVQHLAGTIGPREATSPAYERASRWVGNRFEKLGYTVQRQRIDVPAGNSWGVPVPAGRSVNVIAWPPGFTPEEPHLIVGAHLDTVPQAPGAEDNASGISVMLGVAQAAALARTRLPVVLVAFGAEEPRSLTDPEQHHFGSRAYVAALSPTQRRAVRGMVSLDRVGVGTAVPVGSADDTDPLQRQLLAAGRRAGVPVTPDPDQRSSDHWSFVRAGVPGARIGSTSYVAYHSADDVPAVVSRAQLGRVGRLLLAWLA